MIVRRRVRLAPCVSAFSRRVRPMVVVGVVMATHLMIDVGVVWAKASEDESEETKSWVFPYALVITLVGLGMLAVCRPGQRSNDLPLRK